MVIEYADDFCKFSQSLQTNAVTVAQATLGLYPSTSIPGATRFTEKYWVWNEVHSASWVQLRSYLWEILATPVWKSEDTTAGIRRADKATNLYPQKLAPISPTSGGSSVGIIRSLTEATELVFLFLCCLRLHVSQVHIQTPLGACRAQV
jgi:hypothetical protein